MLQIRSKDFPVRNFEINLFAKCASSILRGWKSLLKIAIFGGKAKKMCLLCCGRQFLPAGVANVYNSDPLSVTRPQLSNTQILPFISQFYFFGSLWSLFVLFWSLFLCVLVCLFSSFGSFWKKFWFYFLGVFSKLLLSIKFQSHSLVCWWDVTAIVEFCCCDFYELGQIWA